jgi:hypothetical protein
MERFFNMMIQQVVRQVVNRGMNAGIERMTRGKGDAATPEQQAGARQNADRVKGAVRMLRRFGRF